MDFGISYNGISVVTNDLFSSSINDKSVCAAVMKSLLANQQFKERFIARYYTVVTEYYTQDYLTATLQPFITGRTALWQLHVDRWMYSPSMDDRYAEMEEVRTLWEDRHPYARKGLYTYFRISESDVLEIIARQSQEDRAVSE